MKADPKQTSQIQLQSRNLRGILLETLKLCIYTCPELLTLLRLIQSSYTPSVLRLLL